MQSTNHTIAKELLRRGVDAVHVCGDELINASDLQGSFDEHTDAYKFRKWRLPRAVAG